MNNSCSTPCGSSYHPQLYLNVRQVINGYVIEGQGVFVAKNEKELLAIVKNLLAQHVKNKAKSKAKKK